MARKSAIYQQLEARWTSGRPVVLDGATGSELQTMGYPESDAVRRGLNFTWGSTALYEREDLTREVHRRYAEAGAQIVETNTFMFHRLWQMEQLGELDVAPGTWRERAKRAVQLAREGAAAGGNPNVGVAFSMMINDAPRSEWPYNGPTARATRPRHSREWVPVEHLRELGEVLKDEPPEAILVELAPDIPADLQFPYYEALMASDIPLWISFRRGAGGRKVGIFGGEFWEGTDDPELFGRAVEKLEALGVCGFMGMCAPADALHGYVGWLRQHTKLPLGVYPNNGQYDQWEWRWEKVITPEEFAAHAREFAAEGANIIGGCCGTRPADIAAMAKALAELPAGT